jgi:dTDP-4-dehydrorhamnose reductase
MTAHWLITGGNGMLGSDLVQELENRGHVAVALGHAQLDICDAAAVADAVAAHRPDVIVNCAAYTAVDKAEEEESMANAINGSAVEALASAANSSGAVLTQVSTDFVFDGTRTVPYEVNDPTSPVSAYGRSKLVGEHAAARADRHLVVRTSWLFGVHGHNFVEAIRNQVNKGNPQLRVVNDQRGRPTFTPHLADALIRLSLRALDDRNVNGIFHYADEDECTWFDFARAIVGSLGATTEVLPVTTDEFPRPARRPAYSVLSTERYERVTGVQPKSWREGLVEYLHQRA